MLVEPNYSEISDEIVPGDYNVRIVMASPGEYSTGTKYIKWTLETYDEMEQRNAGRKIWHQTIIEGKGAFMLRNFLKAVTGSETTGGSFDTEEFLGKELTVTTGLNEKGYVEVKAVRSI